MPKIEVFPNGLKVYQDESGYKFTSDAIELAKFCKIKGKDNVLELCAGSGVIGFYCYDKKPFNSLTFCEIQKENCEIIQKNISLNNLDDATKVINLNLKDLKSDFEYDVVICNPPYFKNEGKHSNNNKIDISRREVECEFIDIAKKISQLLKFGGKCFIVHTAMRTAEIITTLQQFNLIVKRIKFLYGKNKAESVLIEAVKGANDGCVVEV